MTNKPMLSVERELLERAASAIEKHHGSLQWVIASDLRAIIDKPVNFLTTDCPDCACVQDGQCLCIPSKPADHPQCEECKGWGYHENHHEGGGTECGECGGSGKATVDQFSGDTVVCRRYQLEQSPGQNFYHYDIEPVYGSVPVTISDLIDIAESDPVAVVMPERQIVPDNLMAGLTRKWCEGWNDALEEVARLNGVKP